MARPRLLDLFCGAGGAAVGYYRAGFDVVGIDIKPQPHYPFPFIQADALKPPVHLLDFDVIHASPPCQAFTDLRVMWNAKRHPNLLAPTRLMLQRWRAFHPAGQYIIENVEGAPMPTSVRLCGSGLGLGTRDAELHRHRLFELTFPIWVAPCAHGLRPRVIGVYGGHGRDRRRDTNTQDFPTSARREAMGVDWMSGAELSQAIPPAYTEFIGSQLLERIGAAK